MAENIKKDTSVLIPCRRSIFQHIFIFNLVFQLQNRLVSKSITLIVKQIVISPKSNVFG